MVLTKNFTKERWIQERGEFSYMADILSGFNPVESARILDNCTQTEIAKAFKSYQVFNTPEKSK